MIWQYLVKNKPRKLNVNRFLSMTMSIKNITRWQPTHYIGSSHIQQSILKFAVHLNSLRILIILGNYQNNHQIFDHLRLKFKIETSFTTIALLIEKFDNLCIKHKAKKNHLTLDLLFLAIACSILDLWGHSRNKN